MRRELSTLIWALRQFGDPTELEALNIHQIQSMYPHFTPEEHKEVFYYLNCGGQASRNPLPFDVDAHLFLEGITEAFHTDLDGWDDYGDRLAIERFVDEICVYVHDQGDRLRGDYTNS